MQACAPTLRIRSVVPINFLLYLNLLQPTSSFTLQLVVLQAAFALSCCPRLSLSLCGRRYCSIWRGKRNTAKKNKVWQKFSLSAARKYAPVALFISNILLFGLQVGESGRK